MVFGPAVKQTNLDYFQRWIYKANSTECSSSVSETTQKIKIEDQLSPVLIDNKLYGNDRAVISSLL